MTLPVLIYPLSDLADPFLTTDMSISPPSHHFLSLERPSLLNPFPAAGVDTSTVAAADFDVDTHTGFMPPDPPIRRLAGAFATWEDTLERAAGRLKLGATVNSDREKEESSRWRESVRQVRNLLQLLHQRTNQLPLLT